MTGTPFIQIILLVLLGAIVIGGSVYLRRRGILGRWPAALLGAILIALVAFVLLIRPGLQTGEDGRGPGLPADNIP